MRPVHWLPLAALVLVAPSPVTAEIAPQARAIVERYVDATGGRAALEAERSTHAFGRIEAMQLKGTIEQWTQVPDRYLVDIRLGSLRLRTGTDGRVGWETDLDSKRVRILEGKDLDRLRNEAWFENEMWARADQGGGRVSFVSMTFGAGPVLECLEVTSPFGASRRMWFDGKTGLITRTVASSDQHRSELFLSDYQLLSGRRRPTLQNGVDQNLAFLHDELPANRLRIDSLRVEPPGDSTVFSPPRGEEPPIVWLGTPGIARLGFRYGSRHVWIKASINGLPPADFLLDTGASGTTIDRTYAEENEIATEGLFDVQGMGGGDAGSFARARSLRITGPDGDGVQLTDLKVNVVDLGERHEEVLWRRMAGLIGYDVLGRFAVEIDYDRQVVTLRDPKAFVYHGTGAALDMKLMSGIPIVRIDFDRGCGGDFLVDVGNSFGAIVHGSLVRRCRVFTNVADRKQVKIHGGGIGGGFQSWLCRLDTLHVGPFVICDPILALALGTRGMVGSEDYGGNIGNGVLERFKCTFDYLNRKLYLEPGARFAQRDRYSRMGAYLVRSQDRVVAWGVVHGSPAHEAGLKDRDEVIEIDGRPASSYTPEELDRLFVDGEVGATHTLRVLRDYRPTVLTVTLQDVI
ncbi:MAG: aspartyl protease family protein [Candidatus Eiseniibacteriota bacterium]